MTHALRAGLLAVAIGAAGPALAGPSEADEAAIRKASEDFVAAWNRHATKEMAAFWAEDGDLINPWGRVAKGRAEVERLFSEEHSGAGPLRDSHLELRDLVVRPMTADVAVCDWQATLSGVIGPDDRHLPPMSERVTVVAKKVAGAWSCAAARTGSLSPLEEEKPPTPPSDARKASMKNVSDMIRLYQAHGAGLSKPWPKYNGKRFILWLVATNTIDRASPDALAILFSAGDRTRGVEKAGGPAAYQRVTLDSLRSESADLGGLTSYLGRRNGEKAHMLTAAELERGAPIIADLSFPDGAIVGFTGGAVKWMTREDLGIAPGQPIAPGEASPSEILRAFADK